MVSRMSAAGQYTRANVAKIAGEDLALQVMNTNQFVKKRNVIFFNLAK